MGIQVAIAGTQKSNFDPPDLLAKPLKWQMHQTILLPLDSTRLQIPDGTFYLEVSLSIDEQGKVMRDSALDGTCDCFRLRKSPPGYPKEDYETVVETILTQMRLIDGPAFQPGIKDGQIAQSDLIWTFEIQLH